MPLEDFSGKCLEISKRDVCLQCNTEFMIPTIHNNLIRLGEANNLKSIRGLVLQPQPDYSLKIIRMQHESKIIIPAPCAQTEKAMALISAVQKECRSLFNTGHNLEIKTAGKGNEFEVELYLGPFVVWIIPAQIKRHIKSDYALSLRGTSSHDDYVHLLDTSDARLLTSTMNDAFLLMQKWVAIAPRRLAIAA